MSSFWQRAQLEFFKYAFSSITFQILNPRNKSPNIFVFIYLVSNVVFISIYIVKGVQDDSSSKTITYDCVTLYNTLLLHMYDVRRAGHWPCHFALPLFSIVLKVYLGNKNNFTKTFFFKEWRAVFFLEKSWIKTYLFLRQNVNETKQ